MFLYVIYKEETEGDIKIQPCIAGGEVRRFLFQKDLHSSNFAIIEGELLKSFDNTTLTAKGEILCQR